MIKRTLHALVTASAAVREGNVFVAKVQYYAHHGPHATENAGPHIDRVDVAE